MVSVLASAGMVAGIAATVAMPSATADADRLTTWTALNIRSGPGTDHAIVGGLYPGQLITAAGPSRNGWTPVIFNGKKAWVSSRYVKVAGSGKASSDVADSTTASTAPGRRTTTTALNVRTGPSTSYRILNVLARGTTVATTGAYKNGYSEIRYDGRSAWVATQYLTSASGSSNSSTTKLPKVVGTRVTTTALMIRTNSTSNFQSLGDIPTGTKVSITGVQRNGVAQIIFKGAVRWVNAHYLSKSKPATGTDISGIAGNGLSGLSTRSKALLVQVHDRYPQITWYNGVRPDSLPDHPSGRALDIMLSNYTSASSQELGWKIANWVRNNAASLHVEYVIFNQHIWSVARSSEGWRLMADRGSDNANHRNHVHVTVKA